MGFMKDVKARTPRSIAFRYDGTRQSVDNLLTELGPGADPYQIEAVDSSTWRFWYLGSVWVNVDVDQVSIFTKTHTGGVSVDGTPFSAADFDDQFEDA